MRMRPNTMSSTPPPPPVSLGKPSLRHRLESYYSLVAPEAIANKEEWTRKFDIIYNKYGSDHIKETKLANKLANKYGDQVRLLVAPPHRSQRQQVRTSNDDDRLKKANNVNDEQYYKIDTDTDSRIHSKILDFTSPQFDAQYALSAPEGIVAESNASIFALSSLLKLDNISKFRALLPNCDPQRLDKPNMVKRQNNNSNASSTQMAIHNASKLNNETSQKKNKKAPLFLAMASSYEQPTSGPLSLLYSILKNRQRIRIMIRYVDCIRGTLTGYLLAFDKHFNMILKDVDEVYGGRITRDVGAVELASGGAGSSSSAVAAPSKSTLEAQRRKCYPKDGSGGPGPAVKQRYFNQLMVRGDNVVMVWRAEHERSVHPRTNKSPATSAYVVVDSNGGGSGNGSGSKSGTEVGTPGSLYYALQRWENQSGRKRSS